MSLWEIRRTIKGYRCRYRDMWSASRWHAYMVMSALADLKSSGINSPLDLLTFPWEKQPNSIPTEEEADDLSRMIDELNSRIDS